MSLVFFLMPYCNKIALAAALLLIGLTCALSEVKEALTPSRDPRGPFAAVVVTLALLIAAPLLVVSVLCAAALPPAAALGVFVWFCCPGGTFSNAASMGLGGRVHLNAVLTLLSTCVALAALPLVCVMAVPSLLGLPATQVLAPLDELLVNFFMTLVPLPLGVLLRERFPYLVLRWIDPLIRLLLPPLSSIFVGAIAIANIIEVPPPLETPWLLIALLPLGAFCATGALGVLMGQPPRARLSMALEATFHDMPLASSVILSAFSTLGEKTVREAISVVHVLGFVVIVPAIVAMIFRRSRYGALCRALGKGLAGIDDQQVQEDSEAGLSPLRTKDGSRQRHSIESSPASPEGLWGWSKSSKN